jgi:hypothetical protein
VARKECIRRLTVGFENRLSLAMIDLLEQKLCSRLP